MKRLLLTLALTGISSHALAEEQSAQDPLAGTSIKNVDVLLNKLEKQLLEQERESTKFDASTKSPKKEKVSAEYEFPSKAIDAPTNSQDEKLRSLATTLSELETSVDHLSTDVQAAKQKVLENARLNNFVRLSADLASGDKASFRGISLKLDGVEIYTFNENSGLWLPDGYLPVFSGPLPPGNHQIDFESTVVLKNQTMQKIDSSVYKVAKLSKQISVDPNNTNQTWTIKVSETGQNEFAADLMNGSIASRSATTEQ